MAGENKDYGQVLKESFDDDAAAIRVIVASGLIPNEYDSIQLAYTGDNLTEVIYQSGGITIATLTLSYMGDKLTQVDRS